MRIRATISLVIYSLFLFRLMLVVGDFMIDRKQIVQEKCVQRASEQNTCQGKCQLMKQLASENEREKEQSKENGARVWLFHLMDDGSQNISIMKAESSYLSIACRYKGLGNQLAVFQPPEVVC